MKAISIGTRYEIHNDSLKAYDALPAKTYTVRFAQMSGFYLEERTDLAVREKIYGVHTEKANKVLKSFALFERNLGVILSGDKGIGKSLFARCLCEQAVAAGYPFIIVDQFVPGIAAYIESIEQETVFLFDEFDKTFGDIRAGENEANPQTRLLSLFDGTSNGKKLFVITCNDLYRLTDYLVNRPGRFHYHFRFDYPTPEEIREYLTDKLGEHYCEEIEKVILFSKKVSLNYDCLRAIAFELSLGESFEKAILDLNIVNTHAEDYNITLHLENGDTMTAQNEQLDLFDQDGKTCIYLWDEKSQSGTHATFNPSNSIYDPNRGALVLSGDCITLNFEGSSAERKAARETLVPAYMVITRVASRNIHYLTA